ncbi:MAG: TonB family protein [Clostridia bacterium]|nr:TonB family protein [Deltaproteobacteria bacterium]
MSAFAWTIEHVPPRQTLVVYAGTAVASVLVHVAVAFILSHHAPERVERRERPVEVTFVQPPPPVVIPEAPPVPRPVEQKVTPRPPLPRDAPLQQPPVDQPPPPNETSNATEPAAPVFGISMSSTVGPGTSGFRVQVGNTTMTDPGANARGPVKPLPAAPAFVPVYALASPPKAMGDCREPYPQAARAAHVQGKVKLDVEIRDDGTVGEVTPLNKLGYGLEETAVRALQKCTFKPGNDGSKNVATRITYTYVFTYEE